MRVKMAPVTAPPMRGIPKLPASRVPGVPAPPLYLSKVSQNFWIKPLPDSVLYIQFNQVMNAREESLAAFGARLDKTLTDTRPRAVIVDVRHNNGGNLTLLPPLLDAFRRYEQANKRGGRLYVLMDAIPFSGAGFPGSDGSPYTRATLCGRAGSDAPNS